MKMATNIKNRNLNIPTKIMILEIKRLPIEEFILLQIIYNSAESVDEKNRSKFCIKLSDLYEVSGLSQNKLYEMLCNRKLSIWNDIEVKNYGNSNEDFFVSTLIPSVHFIPEEDCFIVGPTGAFQLENITFKEAMFLTDKELGLDKFFRRLKKGNYDNDKQNNRVIYFQKQRRKNKK